MWKLIALGLVVIIFLKPKLLINLINSFYQVIDEGNCGMIMTLGEFTSKHGPGGVFVFPLVQKLIVRPFKKEQRATVVAEIQTKEGHTLPVHITIDYSVSFTYMYKYFYVEDELKEKLSDAVQTVLGIVGSVNEFEAFITHKKGIWALLSCFLQLKQMPHEHPKMVGIKGPIPKEEILDFYERPEVFSKIRNKLRGSATGKNRSAIEEMYGIHVSAVHSTKVEIPGAIQEAIDEDKKVSERRKAVEYKIETIKKLKGEGLDAQGANQSAEVALGQSDENKTFSVAGLSGLLNINIGGGKKDG